MNYKKFLTGLFVMTVLLVALFLFVGCNGNDCGYNCDGGPACGLACNGHGGCVGNAFCDGCTPIGVTICDSCGSCVGLGVDGGRLNMSADKNTYITTDTVFIKGLVMESNGSTYANYSEAVFISITNDTTGKAKIKRVDGGFELTTSSPGSVTVEGKLGDYSDSITIEFVDAEQVLANFKLTINKPQETMYVGNNYQLSVRGNNTIISINQDAVQYTLSENDAMVGISGTTIRAEKEGSVKIQASYTVGDKVFKAEETFNFSPAILKLAIKNQQCIGDKVALSYTIEPSNIYHNDPSYISYAVVGGTATVSRDPSNNNIWYIIATERGDVELKLTYNNGNAVVTSNVTMTFTNQGFTISAASDALFVGYDIPLSATSNLAGFNASTVQYRVVEGDAIIKVVEGVNKLYVNTPGTVKVAATYDHNGAVLDSNELVLTLDYDENTIRTPNDLQKLVNSEVTFNLIADLDLSSYTNWTPIEGFKGTLRGNGHTISGLNIRAANLETNKGLFGHLEGTVENLNINGTITANGEVSKIGLLCGYSTGKINNVTASGTISAEYSSTVGGVVGSSENSNVTDCTSSVNIHAKDNVGGVVGYMAADRSSAAIISGNKNTGTIQGNSSVGGVFGSVLLKSAHNNEEIIMTKNENDGAVSATGNNVGGVVGMVRGESHSYDWNTYSSYIKITECNNRAEISGVDSVGGIAGLCEAYVSEVSFCTNTGDISGNIQVGGYVGYASGTTMRNLINNNTITAKAYLGGIAGYCGKVDSCTNNGTLNVVGYHLNSDNEAISCVGGIAGQVTSAVNCVNNQDINASNGGRYVGGIAGFVSATRSSSAEFKNNNNHGSIVGVNYVGGIFGQFSVQYDHNNEMVLITTNTNDATITGTGSNIGGIIGAATGESHSHDWNGYTAYVKITDCTNTADVSGVDWVGGIVGDAFAYVEEISFSSNTGDITGNLYVGGYAGRGEGTTMRNLKNNNHIVGTAYIGGIAGKAGKLDTCENNGTITNMSYHLDDNNTALSYIGGIAGYATGSVNCTNNSVVNVVNGGHYVGGIAGYLAASRSDDDTLFSGNKNHGDVSGNWYVGGIFGEFAVQYAHNNVVVVVKTNTNDGSVSGASYIGGIIGHAKGESHSYEWDGYTTYVKFVENTNDASVSGNDYIGGIIGSGSAYVSELIMCTHTGDVEGNLYVGGYAGYANGTAMRNMTNNSTIRGKAYIGGIAGYCGKLENCENYGDVLNISYHLTDEQEAVSYAGGLAGFATGSANCTNHADINISSGGNYVGGIVGYLSAARSSGSPISGNKNHGAVMGNNYVGGMFGVVAVQYAHNNESIDIKDNTNDGYVDATGNYVGGIVGLAKGETHTHEWDGYTSTIKVTGCNNDSDVTGADYVGGIVGYCETLVVADDVVWGTNVVGGEVIASGENKGKYYGKLS